MRVINQETALSQWLTHILGFLFYLLKVNTTKTYSVDEIQKSQTSLTPLFSLAITFYFKGPIKACIQTSYAFAGLRICLSSGISLTELFFILY